jgi:hypothetical protein
MHSSKEFLMGPTVLQLEKSRVFGFLGPENVHVCSNNERLDPEAHPGAWALVDSNASVVQPRREPVTIGSKFFVVQATSPQPTRWKEWPKQRSAPLVVMKGWPWGGVFCWRVSRCRSLSLFYILLLTGFYRTKFQRTALQSTTLADVFIKYSGCRYGGSARHGYTLAGDAVQLSHWAQRIPKLLKDIPDIDTFANYIQGARIAHTSQRHLNISSQLISICPGDDRQPEVVLVSKHIILILYDVVLRHDYQKVLAVF